MDGRAIKGGAVMTSHERICDNLGLDPKKTTGADIDRMLVRPHKRPQRCALCGAFYPKFPEGVDKVTCKNCGVEWLRG